MAQDHIWAPLAEGQPTHHREPGQMIYLQDTEAAQFYYILTGTVKCFISSPDGDERTLALHHGGELIGEASFFDRQPRVSSAVAVTPCELISVNRQHLEAVFARRPDLAISMLEYLARTVRLLSGHVDRRTSASPAICWPSSRTPGVCSTVPMRRSAPLWG